MLGYDDPFANVGDTAAAVYYSNLRVVELAPYISNQPVSLTVNQFQSAGFTADAIGTGPFTNVWYQGSSVVSSNVVSTSGDAAAYSIASAAPANDGNYTLVVSDQAGSITSSVVTLSVIVAPAVTNAPVNITTNWHVNVSFSIGVSGTPSTYQWSTNGVDLTNSSHISGATSSTLTIYDIEPSDAGAYTVLVTNAAGVISNSATLTVIIPPSPDITDFTLNGTNASFVFTSTDIYDTTNSFTLQSSTNVTGPYTDVSTSITNSGDSYYITLPKGGPTEFYRIIHQ
jgi:hypothetical protein